MNNCLVASTVLEQYLTLLFLRVILKSMHIYVHPLVGGETLRKLHSAITDAGHFITDTIYNASYVVGILEQEFPSNIPVGQMILLKDSGLPYKVPKGAIPCHVGTLCILHFGPRQSLSQWLKNAPDPLVLV